MSHILDLGRCKTHPSSGQEKHKKLYKWVAFPSCRLCSISERFYNILKKYNQREIVDDAKLNRRIKICFCCYKNAIDETIKEKKQSIKEVSFFIANNYDINFPLSYYFERLRGTRIKGGVALRNYFIRINITAFGSRESEAYRCQFIMLRDVP